MIDSLKELVDYIQISRNLGYQAKLNQLSDKRLSFYNLIANTENPDDESMFEFLYPEGNLKSYQKLKERLHQNLVDVIFFTPNNKQGKASILDIRERCLSQTFLLKLFLFKGLAFNILEISKNLINTCKRYEFYDLLVEILFINIDIYGRGYQNKKKFTSYKRLYERVVNINDVEKEVQLKYFNLFVNFATTQNIKKALVAKELEKDLEYFKNILRYSYSFKSNYFCYNGICIILEIKGEYRGVVEYANKALQYVKSKTQNNKIIESAFLRKKFRVQLQFETKSEILKTLRALETRSTKYSANYYSTALYKTLMWAHQGAYDLVIEELSTLLTKRHSKRISINVLEYLNVVYGYMALLHETNQIHSTHFVDQKFKINKLLNDVPTYSKDKRGVNISILILQILFLLHRRKYDAIIDKVDALNLYSYRYLRKDDSFRSNCFIKMIIKMAKAGFHPISTKRHTEDLFEKLKASPLALSEQPLEVEIIPYEELWSVVMNILEKNATIRRGRPAVN